jgi:hypothetical protein
MNGQVDTTRVVAQIAGPRKGGTDQAADEKHRQYGAGNITLDYVHG